VAVPQEVALGLAAPSDAGILSNLLQLYAYDLSETFGLELGSDGRFKYDQLPLYWSEPERRFPFLIRHGTGIVGFALATRGSPGSDDPQDFDVAEFFVLRRYRRQGIGREAAFLLWNRFSARWIVRVSEGNHAGRQFWTRTISEYTGHAFEETIRPNSPHPWRVFSFDSRKDVPDGSRS
jgi:predicted acetyltransferase